MALMCGPGLNLSQTPKNSQPLRSPTITAVGGSRGSVVRGSGRDSNSIAKRFPLKSNGGTGEPREQSGRFPPSVKRLEKSGSWLSYVQPITLLTFRRPGVCQWRIGHVLERILVVVTPRLAAPV